MRVVFGFAFTVFLLTSAHAQQSIPITSPNPPKPENFRDTDTSRLTANDLVGTWGDGPNCAHPTTFSANGTFKNQPGGATGRWSLQNARLKQAYDGWKTFEAPVDKLNANTFTYGAPEGLVVVYRRCTTN